MVLSVPELASKAAAEKSFQAVHENNLTKVDPITGKVLKRADGKVIKPASYIPVDLHSVVESHDRGE